MVVSGLTATAIVECYNNIEFGATNHFSTYLKDILYFSSKITHFTNSLKTFTQYHIQSK